MISLRIGRSSIDSLSKISRGFWISNVHFSTSSKKPPLETNTSFEFLLHKHGFSPKTVSEIGHLLTRMKNPQNCDSLLSFFNEFGFSNHELETIVKHWPGFLALRPQTTVKAKIKILQDSGLTPRDISELISTYPQILHCGKNKILHSLSILKDLVGSEGEVVARIVKSVSWFLTKDLSKTWVPNVKYLVQCGVRLEQIIKLSYTLPRCLLSKPEVVKKNVERVDGMGVDRSSKMFIHAFCSVSSMNDRNWNMKMQAFRDIGFSEDSILKVFRQFPFLLSISKQKMIMVKDVVLATGKYNMSSIINSPSSLCRSIEGWYKPRLLILEILENKKLIRRWPSLSTLCRMSTITFFEKFVAPHLEEVGNVFMENISSRDRKKLQDVWSQSQIGLKRLL